MGSKIIQDSPQLLEEELISFSAACNCFPVKCSRPAIERWVRRGSSGVILESVLVCGRRYTSREAIDRFVRGQLQAEPDRTGPRKSNLSQKEIDKAARKYRLPEPQSPSQN